MELIDQGNFNLKNGDLDTARQLYEFSLTSVETSGGWYNLGVRRSSLCRQARALIRAGRPVPAKGAGGSYQCF